MAESTNPGKEFHALPIHKIHERRKATPDQKVERQESGLVEVSLAESVEYSSMMMPHESQDIVT